MIPDPGTPAGWTAALLAFVALIAVVIWSVLRDR